MDGITDIEIPEIEGLQETFAMTAVNCESENGTHI